MAAIGSLAWQLEQSPQPWTRAEYGSALTHDQAELAYATLDAWRQEISPLLALPFYAELRRGFDITLARLYAELGEPAEPRRGAHL